MELDYVKEFLVLIDMPNLSEAADKLNVSESSLSRHIKALEDELGCPLFDRTSRAFRLNKYGQMFLPYGRDLVALRQRSVTVLQDAFRHDSMSVQIVSNYHIGDMLDALYSAHPDIMAMQIESPSDEDAIKHELRNHLCTFAFIINFHNSSGEFESHHFRDDRDVVVVPANHRFATRREINLAELSSERFISFRNGSYGDIYLKKLCHAAGFDPTIALTNESGISILRSVSRGRGISILHRNSLYTTGADLSNIACLELIPQHHFSVSLVYRKGAHFSETEQTFLDFSLAYRDLPAED